MNVFAGLVDCSVHESSTSGGKYGPRRGSRLTEMTSYVNENPGCIGGDVAKAIGCYRQLAHAGLWSLEQRGILRSKMLPVSLDRREANAAGMQKHYWVTE